MDFLGRLQQFLQQNNWSNTYFEDKCGIRRGTISSAKNAKEAGKSTGDFKLEHIKKIMLHFREINPYWLILGEGEMLLPAIPSIASETAGTHTTACPTCTHLRTENALLRATIADKELIIQLFQKQLKNEKNNPSPPVAD